MEHNYNAQKRDYSEECAKMETMYFHLLAKFLPLTGEESDSNSNIGPYDDDGDIRPYSTPEHEIDCLLNVRISSQTQQPKPSWI